MLIRTSWVVGVLACAGLALSATPSHAASDSAACNLALSSGAGVDPSANHHYLVGVAQANPTKTVVSMTFQCTLRVAASGATLPSTQLAYVAVGGTAAVAYDVSDSAFNPLLICTSLQVVYTDASRSDYYGCRPLVRI